MSPLTEACVETVGVMGLAVLGAAGGWVCSTRRRLWWLVGYIVPLVFLLVAAIPSWFPRMELLPPFAWIMSGRREMALLGPACMSVLITLLPRLPRKGTKVLFLALMVLVTVCFSILPFLLPAITWRSFMNLPVVLESDGVCIQTFSYTCGPAAAVTALHSAGIDAGEGELAILSHTNRVTGTPPDCLCEAIRGKYGVHCRLAFFNTVDEMRGREPVIAVTKYSLFCDHFVTVLEVKGSSLIIGDPLEGRVEWPLAQFQRKWRGCGIVLDDRSDQTLP
jgi:hypothetical protein